MNGEIQVEASLGEGVHLELPLRTAESAVRYVLEQEGVESAELSLAFLGDDEIARLNEDYLHHAGTTDVISFGLHSEGDSPLGDVYIGVEQARRQAEELRVPIEEELLRLVVHGTLHVLGYDHPEGPDRSGSEMYLRQEELLTGFLDRIRATGR